MTSTNLSDEEFHELIRRLRHFKPSVVELRALFASGFISGFERAQKESSVAESINAYHEAIEQEFLRWVRSRFPYDS